MFEHRHCIGLLSVAAMSREVTQTPLASAFPPLWGKGLSEGKGKNTHLKGTEPAQAQTS